MNVYAPIGAMKVMGTSIIIYFVALTITPSAQATLQPEDVGVGKSNQTYIKKPLHRL